MATNWLIVLIASLVPLSLGAVWYNPAVLGNAYPKTESDQRKKHPRLVYVLAIIFSILLSTLLRTLVIHQTDVYALLMNQSGFDDPNSEMSDFIKQFMLQYGTEFRTFTHGSVHGVLIGLFGIFPILAIHALFEGHGWKYIGVHVGYWIVSLAIMGGILCAWG